MFRVVCIDDSQQYGDGAFVVKGNIYTVIDCINQQTERKDFQRVFIGIHYILAEIGDDVAFHNSMFIKINEDQQDETEMERDYETKTEKA